MLKGTVKWFNKVKGLGFVTCEKGNDYFVHYSGIAGKGYKLLTEGSEVTFLVEETERGLLAKEVTQI